MPERPADWKGSDWWGNKDSLTAPYYDGSTNPEVVEAFKKAKANPETTTILLTGRRGVAAGYVRNVLQQHDLYGKRMIGKGGYEKHTPHPKDEEPGSHQEFFMGDFSREEDYPQEETKKGMRPAFSTLAHKTYVVNKLVNQNGGFETVEIFDDRQDHIQAFKQLLHNLIKSGLVKNAIIHQIYPPIGSYQKATVVTMNIR